MQKMQQKFNFQRNKADLNSGFALSQENVSFLSLLNDFCLNTF